MNKLFLTLVFSLVLVSCQTDETVVPDPERPVDDVDVDLSQFENVTFCEHNYSDNRNFYYQGQVKSYTQELFGESVTTFEFTLLNNQKHFLSSQELENYVCESVKP